MAIVTFRNEIKWNQSMSYNTEDSGSEQTSVQTAKNTESESTETEKRLKETDTGYNCGTGSEKLKT